MKSIISLLGRREFFMNTEKNQKIWIEKIHENLLLRGRSKQTFLNYKCALNRFFKYYSSDVKVSKLKENDIIIYLRKRIIDKNMCTDTYNLNVAAIRLLYLVCFNVSLNKLLIPNCKNKKRLPTILDKQTFITIVNNEKNLKHQCWLLLGFCCGLRVSKIANIKLENILISFNKLKVSGKGNKDRYTIIPNIVIKALKSYCIKNNIKSGYIFKGNNNKDFMNEKTITNYFSTIKEQYNLNDNISFHSLRHSFATYYLKSGGSLLKLQYMLGHNNLNTTTIYLHLTQNYEEVYHV